jgi:hypothetical protein
MSKTGQKLLKGDVVVYLTSKGDTKLAVCTQADMAYDRQGGEGAILQFENGSSMQLDYCNTSDFLVIHHLDVLEANPLRQLLLWRQRYER